VARTDLEVRIGHQFAASVLIVCAGLLLFGPAVAPLIARVGLRAVALRGAAPFCIGVFTVGSTGPKVWTWYAAWTMVALANPAVNNTVWTTAVTRLYRHNRGLALSTALSGVGLASFIAPPVALWIAGSFGWRGAYFAIAIGSLFLIVPSLWAHAMQPFDGDRRAVYLLLRQPADQIAARIAHPLTHKRPEMIGNLRKQAATLRTGELISRAPELTEAPQRHAAWAPSTTRRARDKCTE